MAWWITFTLVATLLLCLGFGPKGIIPGIQPLTTELWMILIRLLR
jgi:hypothetical protein